MGWLAARNVSAPFAEFTWRHARRLAADKGVVDSNENEVARVVDDLLTRAQPVRLTSSATGSRHAPGSPAPRTAHRRAMSQRRP